MEMLAISETSAPSVIFASENATSPVTSDGGGFKWGFDGKMRPPLFFRRGRL